MTQPSGVIIVIGVLVHCAVLVGVRKNQVMHSLKGEKIMVPRNRVRVLGVFVVTWLLAGLVIAGVAASIFGNGRS